MHANSFIPFCSYSYFMGIMNRYMRGERQNPLTRGSNRVRDNRQHEFQGANDDRFSHYVKKKAIMPSAIEGTPLEALCGKKWVPSRDPEKFPICPECKEIYDALK